MKQKKQRKTIIVLDQPKSDFHDTCKQVSPAEFVQI